jgi:fructose-1-phosphate kinase PfkB-like protein
LEKDKKRVCGNPRHHQESANRYGQHQERAEMMIVTLTAQRASFFHAEKAYPASSETVKLRTPTARKRMQTAVTIATAACCSPSTQ